MLKSNSLELSTIIPDLQLLGHALRKTGPRKKNGEGRKEENNFTGIKEKIILPNEQRLKLLFAGINPGVRDMILQKIEEANQNGRLGDLEKMVDSGLGSLVFLTSATHLPQPKKD
jgi:hypothetical protein